jgi:hypothetical protein
MKILPCLPSHVTYKQIKYFFSSRSVQDTIAKFSNAMPCWAEEYGRIPTLQFCTKGDVLA